MRARRGLAQNYFWNCIRFGPLATQSTWVKSINGGTLEAAAWQKLSLCIGFVLQAIGNVSVYGCCSLTGMAIRMTRGCMSSHSNASAELALKSIM
ncbi:hypothetical protein Pyn_07674 [Prunus yedoensis var. nudiflora]|uniref:Uncharacterized protein n=1 Tax=Prunus yedoensis var. nudiflora TaxID=2094558 RepID=A0A314Y1H4_PRUYE|nr:hypothetical protein Pyn_07674 [Prunus yedoensis var. nudiflora]